VERAHLEDFEMSFMGLNWLKTAFSACLCNGSNKQLRSLKAGRNTSLLYELSSKTSPDMWNPSLDIYLFTSELCYFNFMSLAQRVRTLSRLLSQPSLVPGQFFNIQLPAFTHSLPPHEAIFLMSFMPS
jgi:hypothetical protein